MGNGTFLYPSVTSLPSQGGVTQTERPIKKQEGVPSEFDQVFDKTLEKTTSSPDLDHVKAPLKFSAHATQRLRDRKIAMDPSTMAKVSDAVDKAEAKGIEDTLVLTNDAALIVSVKNRTVITALDKGSLSGNVFTNIDGAVIV
jgi:flagellar operon protein